MKLTARYAAAGFGLGFLFPLGGILIEFWRSGFPFGVTALVKLHHVSPLLYIIETAPFILSALLWAIGRSRARLEDAYLAREAAHMAYARFYPEPFIRLLHREGVEDLQVGDCAELPMTVMFSDIRGFTGLSADLADRDLFDFLSGYYRAITPTITANHGIVDKFIGDAVMAIFPASGASAVRAAQGILGEMRFYNQSRSEAGAPAIRVGIGMHSGPLVLGTIGDSTRMNTTALGDTVNISARLESLTKKFFTPVIVSDTVYKTIPSGDQDLCREIGHALIRGRGTSLTLYEYFGGDEPELIERKRATMPTFLMALFHMQAKDYSEAHRLFAEVQKTTPEDPLPVIFMNRCERGRQGIYSPLQRKRQRTAMVVDDNPAVVRLIETVLIEAGWRVEGVPGGRQALSIYAHLLPDLVLLDRTFPEMDGVEAAAGIRRMQRESGKFAPIIGITADTDDERNREFLAAGLDRILRKPFQPAELLAAVEDMPLAARSAKR